MRCRVSVAERCESTELVSRAAVAELGGGYLAVPAGFAAAFTAVGAGTRVLGRAFFGDGDEEEGEPLDPGSGVEIGGSGDGAAEFLIADSMTCSTALICQPVSFFCGCM